MSNLFILGIYDGLIISTSTLILTFILDLISFNSIQLLFQKNGGKELYKKSVFTNLFNHLILGTLSYGCLTYFISLDAYHKSYFNIIIDTFLLLLTQSIGYYLAHILMHTNRFYYIHKFHHQYSDVVIPMSANAVSAYEYIIAYMMPFIIGIILFKPDRIALRISISLVSFANLLIHTPWLSESSDKFLSKYFVKTSDHLEHHQK